MKNKIIPFFFLALVMISCGDSGSKKQVNSVAAATFRCPSGYIQVPGNALLETSDFCVMKFEAKNDGGTPVSQASGTPWVNINASGAQSECESINVPSYTGQFTLISNPEWMTIARNIEGTAANWSSGTYGDGYIPYGHADGSPNNALAVSDTNDPYNGTGNSAAQAPGSGWEQKRTHVLSNGNLIWDLAANVQEFVDWDAGDSAFTRGPSSGILGADVYDFSHLPSGTLTLNDAAPLDPVNDHSRFFGQWVGSDFLNAGAAIRGSYYQDSRTGFAGVFSLNLEFRPTITSPAIGFRCVYRP